MKPALKTAQVYNVCITQQICIFTCAVLKKSTSCKQNILSMLQVILSAFQVTAIFTEHYMQFLDT